jgi:monofunctional biosynthetic peptidoglycan transglycosylase
VYFFGKANYIRKGLEAYFTVLIELFGKERIMEVYLNSIRNGMEVYGAQAAAAEHWYRKSFWSYTKTSCRWPF